MLERLILAFKRSRGGDSDHDHGNGSPLLNYFKVVFNFGYILFLIPFRLRTVTVTVSDPGLESDCENQRRSQCQCRVQLASNRIHEWICGTVHTLIIFEYLSMARRRLSGLDLFSRQKLGLGMSSGGSGGAFESLQTVGCVACLVYGAAFIYTFWGQRRRDAWLRAFRLIDEIELVADPEGQGQGGDSSLAWTGFKINMLTIALGAMYTTFGFMDTTFEHNFRVETPGNGNLSTTATGFFTKHYAETQEFYFFQTSEHEYDGNGNIETWGSSSALLHAVTSILTVVRLAIAFPKFLLIQMLEWTVFMTVLCLRHVIANFLKLRPGKRHVLAEIPSTETEEQLLVPTDDSEHPIFAHYDRLKDLVKALNSATKVLTFSCIGVALPFYASWIVIVFFEEDVQWRQFAHFYFYFGVFFTLLVLAAEFNAKSVDFYRWIARGRGANGKVSPTRFASILIDLQCNEVAVKGSAIFVVTYRFIGGFLSVIVTYTIIMLQFQVSRRSRVV